MPPASKAVCRAFTRALGGDLTEWPGLPKTLGRVLERAHTAWPQLELDEPSVVAHIAQRLPAPTAAALDAAHVEDLALAAACTQGTPAALETFDAEVLRRVDAVARRYDAQPAFVDEVRQALRQKLFLPPPRIADYTGEGPLVAWLRAAAARTALNLLRPEKRAALLDRDELEALPLAAPEPELAILKSRHRATFREAFRQALATLPVRERAALKLNALEGLTLEKIGALYGKDKSTVSRWLAHAQATLLDETRCQLMVQLAVRPDEVESLMQDLKSQLVSVVQLLGA